MSNVVSNARKSNVVLPVAEAAHTKFTPRADNKFLKRHLNTKSLMALEILNKIANRFDKLVKAEDDDAVYLFCYTATEAAKAIDKGFAYGEKTRYAYLPPVFRHLMVQVGKNFKANHAAIVQEFTNNAKFMAQLDESWKNPVVIAEPELTANDHAELAKIEAAKTADVATKQVVARLNIPSELIESKVKTSIKKGSVFFVDRRYHLNGEDWYAFTNGISAPVQFFADVLPVVEDMLETADTKVVKVVAKAEPKKEEPKKAAAPVKKGKRIAVAKVSVTIKNSLDKTIEMKKGDELEIEKTIVRGGVDILRFKNGYVGEAKFFSEK